MRVLVVEDDALIALGLLAGLRAHGLVVDHAATASQARAAVAATDYAVAVLDLGLPDEDGMQLLRAWRAAGVALPVLILSARSLVEQRVSGLQTGADDYLVKPFELSELMARLFALTRRAAGRSVDMIEWGSLRLDPVAGRVSVAGQDVVLSRRELSLLMALLNAQGRILSAEQIKDNVYAFDDEIESNALNVHIHHLRRKLGVDLIETVRGQGYRLSNPAQCRRG